MHLHFLIWLYCADKKTMMNFQILIKVRKFAF